jgi:DNA-binding NarL/FixJ family response regulator
MAFILTDKSLIATANNKADGFPIALDTTAGQISYDATVPFAVIENPPQIIQIVERLHFIRESLKSWMQLADAGIEVISRPDASHLRTLSAARLRAVVVTGHTLQHSAAWFEEEIAWLGPRRPQVPIVAVVPDEMESQAEEWIEHFSVSGFILSSSSPEVARAVLHLVMAGTTHFPRFRSQIRTNGQAHVETGPTLAVNGLGHKLTDRERDVVDHVGRGYPNKVIARELNMSLSTVKAHMHNIIQKLNVKNRTEVAIAARTLQLGVRNKT